MNAKNIFGAICVAVALFFLWPGVFGAWSQLQALRDARTERQALAAKREEILANATKEYARLKQLLQRSAGTTFSSLVPTKKDSAELVSALSTIAATSGLQLTRFETSEPAVATTGEPYATLVLQIELSGDYGALRTFLTDLETYVRILNVRRLEIARDPTSGALSYKIEAETYYVK